MARFLLHFLKITGQSLSVNWEPDIWGFARAGQSALIADAQSEGQNYRAARASLAAQVIRAWLALAEGNEQIVLAETSTRLFEQTMDIVRDRFTNALAEKGGSASQFRLTESQFESSKATLAQRKGEREQAIRQLELLLGRYPAGGYSFFGKTSVDPTDASCGIALGTSFTSA